MQKTELITNKDKGKMMALREQEDSVFAWKAFETSLEHILGECSADRGNSCKKGERRVKGCGW